MSDLQVTLNGKSFTIDVPDSVMKNKDEDFVTKAAQLHYNTKFAGGGVGKDASPSLPVSKPPELLHMENPAPQDPEIRQHLLDPKIHTPENPGYLESAKNAFKGLGNAIMHPIDTFSSMANGGTLPPKLLEMMHDPHADRGVVGQEIYSHFLEDPIIPFGTVNKAVTGDMRGALGDVTPQLIMGAATSPRIGALGKGIGKGLINADYPRMNLSRLSLPGVIGGGIASLAKLISSGAVGTNFWEGAGIGAGVGAAAKSIPPMVRSIGREVPIATAGKSWLPNFGRNISPIERPNPVEFGDAVPKVGAAPLPGEIKQLGPATQVQMPPAGNPTTFDDLGRPGTSSPHSSPVNRPSNETVNRPVHREMQVQTSPEVKTATTPIVSRESPINPEVLPREAPTPTGPTPEEIEFAKENEGALRRLGVSNIDNYTGRTIDVTSEASEETPAPKKKTKNREETVRMFAERRRKYLLEREKTRFPKETPAPKKKK